jgi:L-lysine 2,3-aminomutase
VRNKAAYDTLKPMDNSTWQQQIGDGIRNQDELLKLSGNAGAGFPTPKIAIKTFPLRVPRSYLKRMEKNNPNDPLLRQVLPVPAEEAEIAGYNRDPVGEIDKHASPGLIQKYEGRALLITTNACAIHCRYCFRRHYPYADNLAGRDKWTTALETLRADPGIKEIILSGGDPLSMADDKLGSLILQLEQIPHLIWLRLHTRIPIVMPDRVSSGLLNVIGRSRFKQTLVVHANHPNEIDDEVASALDKLHGTGIQLLNQSVLLRGVNDDARILAQLSERLYLHHVLPYYLHMLDPVAGAAHFEVPEKTARRIMQDLRVRLPGYLVPRLVREIDGEAFKTPLG